MNSHYFILLFLIVGSSSECFGTNCKYIPPKETQIMDRLQSVIPVVDKQVRRAFQTFISQTNLRQLSSIAERDRSLMIFIYQNIRGVFLVISSWYNKTKLTQVNMITRLGHGRGNFMLHNYHPFDADAYRAFLTKQQKYYRYYYDESDTLVIVQCLQDREVHEYLKQKYWYYLRDAEIVEEKNKDNEYFTVIMKNVVGTFHVHYQCMNSDKIKINSIVRMAYTGQTQMIIPLKQNQE